MHEGDTAVDISAVIINWNTGDLLEGCLASLRAHPAPGRRLEIIVVDNGSTDGSQERVRSNWPDVRLVANQANLGFTRATNQGIRVSQGKYLLLINADAQLTAGCLERMLVVMEADPRAGAVGPRLVYGDGRWQRWTAGREPTLGAAINYYFFAERVLPTRGRARGLYLGRDVREPFQPDWVTSACMLVRRAAVDEVGLLDERFFVYMDDVDLCRRLREGGWRVWYEPRAEAVHFMGQSHLRETGSVSPRALRTFNRYYAMRHGAPSTVALKVIEGAGHGLRAAAYATAAAAFARTRGGARLRSMARAHWTYCKVSLEPRIER